MNKRQYIIIFLMLLSYGCSFPLSMQRFNAEPLKDGENINITGTFTLILYGMRYSHNFETVAILDREGDGYEFEPFAPEFAYRIKKNLPADKALSEAESFVGQHPGFRSVMVRKITDEKGSLLGYEVRPFYYSAGFGSSLNVVKVYYFKSGNKIIPKIELRDTGLGDDWGKPSRGGDSIDR